jgi:hypothetical protein
MIIRKAALQAALTATASDASHYFLNSVQIEPSTHRVISTNGHVLLIATDTAPMADADFPAVPGAEFHGDPDTICVAADVVRSMIATMPKKSSIPILSCAQLSQNGSPATATIAATDLQAPRVATITRDTEQRFPAYERIMTSMSEGGRVRVSLAVDVLEVLIKAAKAIGDKRAPVITFDVPTDGKDGAVVGALGITIVGSDVTVTGAVMPCRL